MTDYAQQFARSLWENRFRLNMGQDDLERVSGVPRKTIDRWEVGLVRSPQPEQVRAVCEVLGIDYNEVAGGLGIAD